jgi:Ca2+-binding RTX toxin-like protein
VKATLTIDPSRSGRPVTDDYFAVVLKSSIVPPIVDDVRDWSMIDHVIQASGATSIRYPGGTESWRDFDFTNQLHVEELKSIIDLCARWGLDLHFTVSLRQFFVENDDPRLDGSLEISADQIFELANFIKTDLLDYAQAQNVEVTRIQLDNEPLHRNFDGHFLNHREYGGLANIYAELIGNIVDSHVQKPEILLVTASGEGAFDRNNEPTFGGAWGIRSIIGGIADQGGARHISGVDLHMGGWTLHSNYSVFSTDQSDVSLTHPDNLLAWLDWQKERWNIDAISPENSIGNLSFHISAWSYPQRENGGASLQNAGLGILHMHTYSMAGVQSVTNYTLMGGDANALYTRSGRESPGGAMFGMMSDSLVGLRAVNLNTEPSESIYNIDDVIFRAFLNDSKLVLYAINTQAEQRSLSIDISNLAESSSFFIGGIADMSIETLGVSIGQNATSAYTTSAVRRSDLNPSELKLAEVLFSLDGYEIAEITTTANIFSLYSHKSGEIIPLDSIPSGDYRDTYGRHFVDGTGVLKGTPNSDYFLMGNGTGLVLGGLGDDTLSFARSEKRVTVWFGEDIAEAANGELQFVDIERIDGSVFDDRIVSHKSGKFWGLDGDDTFEFWSSNGSVARGGSGNDQFLVYEAADNFLYGGSGDDRFFAFSGLNEISGGVGNDTISMGGEHENKIHFWSGDGDDVIINFKGGSDRLFLYGISSDQISSSYVPLGILLDFGADGSIRFEYPDRFDFSTDVFLF